MSEKSISETSDTSICSMLFFVLFVSYFSIPRKYIIFNIQQIMKKIIIPPYSSKQNKWYLFSFSHIPPCSEDRVSEYPSMQLPQKSMDDGSRMDDLSISLRFISIYLST